MVTLGRAADGDRPFAGRGQTLLQSMDQFEGDVAGTPLLIDRRFAAFPAFTEPMHRRGQQQICGGNERKAEGHQEIDLADAIGMTAVKEGIGESVRDLLQLGGAEVLARRFMAGRGEFGQPTGLPSRFAERGRRHGGDRRKCRP